MRIALVSLSVGGALGQYTEALVQSLSRKTETRLFVPAHYEGDCGQAVLHTFPTGNSHSRALLSLLNPLLAWRVWCDICRIRPDVVHLLTGDGYPWALLWAAWAQRQEMPFIVTVHDPERHPGYNLWEMLNARLRRSVLGRATGVHIHSQRFTELITAQGFKSDNIFVIPHGSLAQRFLKHCSSAAGGDQAAGHEPLALFFGRLEAYKGLDLLAEAAFLLNGSIRFAIAGPGRLPPQLEASFREHPELFEFHNRYLDDDEVAVLFQRAAVCVLPYKQATQSSVPLISAAFGVPVVATAVGAFIDDVPRVSGILVHPNDAAALAQGIQDALGRVPCYPRELEFDMLVDEFLKMYRQTMDHKPPEN
jgi:glycosyltransferase involved in cell wall biosynthesis